MNEQTRLLNEEFFSEQTVRSKINDLLGSGPVRSNYKNDGRGFQKEIETTCGGYQSRRTATIRKVDPPTRLVGTGAARKVLFLQNPFLDFVGSWTKRHGRAIFFECKSTASHRLRLGDGGLTETQCGSLSTWRHASAAAFVLWQWSGKVALFTPEMVNEARARGEKSLVHEAGVQVPHGEGAVIWDFLAVLEAVLWPVSEKPGQENNLARE